MIIRLVHCQQEYFQRLVVYVSCTRRLRWCRFLWLRPFYNSVIQPCSTGKTILRSQLELEILSEPATTDSDVEEAYPPPLELLDSDQEGDSDIEVD